MNVVHAVLWMVVAVGFKLMRTITMLLLLLLLTMMITTKMMVVQRR